MDSAESLRPLFPYSFQATIVSLIQLYVRISELLLMFQEAAVPASGTASAAPSAADGAGAAAGEAAKTAPGAAGQGEPSPFVQFAPILIIGFFFYFILLRPQQKEQKKRQEFLNNLKKNSKVVTTGGMIGTVVEVSSDGRFVTLKVDDSTRLKFLRSAIQQELDEKVEATGSAT